MMNRRTHFSAPVTAIKTRATIAVALVIGALLIAAGCGGDGGGDGGGTNESSLKSGNDAGIIPMDAAAIVAVSIETGKDSDWMRAREVLRRIPAYKIVDDEIPTLDELVAEASTGLDDRDIDFSDDIKPILGDVAGGAGWLKEDAEGADSESFGGFIWVDVTDEEKAFDLLERAIGDEGEKEEIDGVNAIVATDGEDGIAAVFDDRVVVASDRDSFEKVLDARDGDAFEESDEWETLTNVRDGKEDSELAGLILTSNFAEQYGRMTKASFDESDVDDGSAELLQKFTDSVSEFSYSQQSVYLGVTDRGFWVDSVSETPFDTETVEGSDVVDVVGRMPQQTLAVMGSKSVIPVDQMEKLRDGLIDFAEDAATLEVDGEPLGDHKLWQRYAEPTLTLVEDMTNDDLYSDAIESTGPGAFAMTADNGDLSFVSAGELNDADLAADTNERYMELFDGYMSELYPDVDYFEYERDGDDLTARFTNLPVEKLDKALADMDPEARTAIQANQNYDRYFSGELEGLIRIDDDSSYSALPSDAIELIETSWVDEKDQLSGNTAYERDLKGTDVDGDAVSFGWIDLPGIIRGVAQTVEPQAAAFVEPQLQGVGGMMFWSVEFEADDEQFTRSALEFPLYK